MLKTVIKSLDCVAVYFSVQLGRCVLFSFAVLAVILLLRRTVLRNHIFLKGMSWAVCLAIPFVGRLRLFYEVAWMIRLFWWWNALCMQSAWVRHGSLAGVFVTAAVLFYRRRRIGRFVRGMEKRNLCGREIRLGDCSVTPFTTGLICPQIILPRVMAESFSEEELRLVCQHEQTHIRLGHLWVYLLWDIGRSLLWMNPCLSVCTKFLREDLEDICDRVTIQRNDSRAYEYGKLLLKSMSVLRTEPPGEAPAFAEMKEYRAIKRRFARIAEFRPYRRVVAVSVIIAGIVAVSAIFILIHQQSYPAYTEYEEIRILSDAGEWIEIENQDVLRQAVQIGESEVTVDRQRMRQIFEGQGISLDSYFILFGGYMKLPGIGGGGNAVYVSDGKAGGKLRLAYRNNDTRWMTRVFSRM